MILLMNRGLKVRNNSIGKMTQRWRHGFSL